MLLKYSIFLGLINKIYFLLAAIICNKNLIIYHFVFITSYEDIRLDFFVAITPYEDVRSDFYKAAILSLYMTTYYFMNCPFILFY